MCKTLGNVTNVSGTFWLAWLSIPTTGLRQVSILLLIDATSACVCVCVCVRGETGFHLVVRCEAISIASSYVRKIGPESLLQSGQTQQSNSIKVTTCTRHERGGGGRPCCQLWVRKLERGGGRDGGKEREGESETRDERESQD